MTEPLLSRVELLLARPDEQRLREYKYRCAQALIFGLPVMALEYFGRSLGAEYGQTLVCGTARLGGFPVGIVANQHHRVRPADGPLQFGGVLYVDSAEKVARFVMNCNQDFLPIIFTGHLGRGPILFHVVIALLATWTGARWWQWSRRRARVTG